MCTFYYSVFNELGFQRLCGWRKKQSIIDDVIITHTRTPEANVV